MGEQLGQRLESLQRALEDERVISRVGENVARLAHGLKNAVHSLRGFVALIEPQLDRASETNAALAGLRAAIDDLDTEFGLEARDVGRHVGLHRVERPRGRGEAAVIGDGDNGVELLQVHRWR